MNLYKYKVTRKNGHVFSKIFTINEIENGYAQTWLKNNIVYTDELERLPYVTTDKNGDKVFAGDKVKSGKRVLQIVWDEKFLQWRVKENGNFFTALYIWAISEQFELIKDKDLERT